MEISIRSKKRAIMVKQIVKIELKNIDSFKDHPFKAQRDDSLNELKESIKENGLLELLLVR